MIVYLTSSPGDKYRVERKGSSTGLNRENGFVDSLKAHWREHSNVMIISSDPNDSERNDRILQDLQKSFSMSGLSSDQFLVCDSRNEEAVMRLKEFDAVILAGGHVPTQNQFFHKIHLKEELEHFDGILIGISAGTMNSARVVYAQPELEGESIDPGYQRFLNGLGLTDLMILPHYQAIKDDILDGKCVMEEITYPDSLGREFYALVDGSYVLIKDGAQTLYGEGYRIKDGTLRKICRVGESIFIP